MRRLAFFLCLLVVALPAHALRCGGRVVQTGDSSLRLIQFCGEPARVENREDRIAIERYDSRRGEYYTEYVSEPYELWTYNFGPRRFINIIEIRDGVIRDIRTGGYGF